MDTLFVRLYEDKVLGWLTIAALTVLLFSFFLSAKAAENLAYNITPVIPDFENSVKKIETSFDTTLSANFDNEIKNKYPKGEITTLAKGVKRIKIIKYFNSRPVRLNIIETNFKLNPKLAIKPAIAGTTLKNKSKIRKFNEQENAIVSINGGYFKPETGIPLGLLMIDKRIYTGHIYNRVAMGIFEDGFKMAQVKADIKLTFNGGEINVDNINQPRILANYTLVYDSLWGNMSPPAPKGGKVISVSNGKIIQISTQPIKIPEKGFVISAPSSKLDPIIKHKDFRLKINTSPNWQEAKHIISGGPYLIKDGEIYIDITAQKLKSITGRNPRTAIGYTADGNIIIITADGREKSSVGLTLGELARFMKEIGCINAMNLDGGSSTVMFGAGKILNSPQFPEGIAVSNSVNIITEN